MAQRRSRWIPLLGVPLAFAAVAVGILLVFANLNSPLMAQIDQASVASVDGEVQARISWPAGDAHVRTAEIILPPEYQDATQVPIEVLPDGTVEIDDSNQGLAAPAPLLLLAVLIGAVFGLVVLGNVRGYGYIRGTGEPGTMEPAEVDEDRAFYWRS